MDFWLTVIIGSLIFGFVGMAIADHKHASKPAGFWLGFFLWPIGLVIAALLGPPATAQKVEAASRKKPTKLDDAIERDLSNARYKVWLIEAYGIEKNEVLGEFLCGENSFKTVDEALEFAHGKEVEKLAEAEAQRQRRELERQAEHERMLELKAEREAEEKKTQKLLLIIVGVLLVIAIPFIYQQTKEDQAEARAQEIARVAAKVERDARAEAILTELELDAGSISLFSTEPAFGAPGCGYKTGTIFTFDATEEVGKRLRKRLLETGDTRDGYRGYMSGFYIDASPYRPFSIIVCDIEER